MYNLPRREFLMLAKKYLPEKTSASGYYISEKLDGTRVLWDGGLSRGVPTLQVPYANVNDPKTGKLKKKIKPVATGLWSRYGNPVIAPDWFLNLLPSMPLDGEIWAGRGNFQLCRSICAGDVPGPDWDKAEFAVFGCPPLNMLFSNGRVNNPHMVKNFVKADILKWVEKRRDAGVMENYITLSTQHGQVPFEYELTCLHDALDSSSRVYLHRQRKLPLGAVEAANSIEMELQRIIALGGEGVVLRSPEGAWLPKRVPHLLKYKPYDDDEGTIIGFTSGRRTDKGSRLLGKIGALILDYKGKRLELAGLNDDEREFDGAWQEYAKKHPGEDMPTEAQGVNFKVGQRVTFKYRELSDDGIPKEARYWRQR